MGEGEGEREGEGEGKREGEEEEEEELLPDRSELSLSLLAERDRRAGFFFFLIIFFEPLAFGGSMIMSSGSIAFAFPFSIVLSKILISSTCNANASINDWQEYEHVYVNIFNVYNQYA